MRLTGPFLLLGSIAYFAALAPYGLNLDDEGTLLYQIYRTYAGQRLYVDFHAGYTPGIFQWNAALFSLFGVNVLWIRLCLALVNGTSVYCLYWLARRLGAARGAAACAGLLYLAFIPFYDGQFGAFNIPYPIWYVTLFWLLSLVSALHAWRGRFAWWLAAGVCAGAVFSFKPNSGLLNLAGLLIALCLENPTRDVLHATVPAVPAADWRHRFLARFLRWFIPVTLLLSLTSLFARGAGEGTREVMLFALPLIVVVLVGLRRALRQPPPAGLLRDLALLGLGFSAVIAPWVAWYLFELGPRALLRAILFIGTNFDRFYYLPYPRLGRWEALLVLGFAALWALGALLRDRVLPRGLFYGAAALGALVAATWLVLHPPPMVEGFQSSVVTRVRVLAFGLTLSIEWLAVAAWLRGREWAREPRIFLLLVGAVLMHMQLYPRTDFMHLVPACPLLLVLGAWLLDRLTRLWSRGLAHSRRRRGLVRAALVSPVIALVLVLIAPALGRIEYLARAALGGAGTQAALVRLESAHAPLVVEPAAGKLFLGLSQAAAYLRANAAPSEGVFTFPALDLVCFLADRHNPTRHGYFYPGWPGHEVEAEVIEELRRNPPRFVVSLHAHALYFMAAPAYYFNLRQWVTEAYEPVARFGTFDILAPRDGGDRGPDVPEVADLDLWRRELELTHGGAARRLHDGIDGVGPEDATALAAALAGLDPGAQRLAADMVRKSRSRTGAAALAQLLSDRALTPTVRELFVRAIAEAGDLSAAPALLDLLRDPDMDLRLAAGGDLYAIASRGWLEDFWWVPPPAPDLTALRRRLMIPQLMEWIDDPWQVFTLRAFAIQMSGLLRLEETAPFLMKVAGSPSESPHFRTDATFNLYRLGRATPLMPMIGRRLADDTVVAPALLARLYRTDPELGYRSLSAAMASFNDAERSTAYWVATAVDDPRLEPLFEKGLTDGNEQVRLASQWARSGAREDVPAP